MILTRPPREKVLWTTICVIRQLMHQLSRYFTKSSNPILAWKTSNSRRCSLRQSGWLTHAQCGCKGGQQRRMSPTPPIPVRAPSEGGL